MIGGYFCLHAHSKGFLLIGVIGEPSVLTGKTPWSQSLSQDGKYVWTLNTLAFSPSSIHRLAYREDVDV